MKSLKILLNEASLMQEAVDKYINDYTKQLEQFQKTLLKDKYEIFRSSITVNGEDVDVVVCGSYIDRSFDRKPNVRRLYMRKNDDVIYEGRTLSVNDIIKSLKAYLLKNIDKLM